MKQLIKKKITRNSIVGIIGILIYVISLYFRLVSYDIPNYQTIVSDTISFASFITCLMFIGLAYLPNETNSKFLQASKDLKTSIILMHQILITIAIYFSLSIICICALVFSNIDIINIPLTSLWLSLFISGFLEVSVMLVELFNIILYIAKEHQNKNNHKY